MVSLMRQQRFFLNLLIKTTTLQRKALLNSVTNDQIKALCQIAVNILRSTITLTNTEIARLKRSRQFLYILGDKKVEFREKRKAIENNSRTVLTIVKIAVKFLDSVLH